MMAQYNNKTIVNDKNPFGAKIIKKQSQTSLM